jgi:acyl-coenzyme A thioesterase 13
MQVGRTMAMIRGTMCSPDGKTIYATCEHHKVAVPTRPEHLKYLVPWDDLWKEKAAKL